MKIPLLFLSLVLSSCAITDNTSSQDASSKSHIVKRIHDHSEKNTHKVKQIYDINNEIPRNLYVFQPEYLSINVGDTVFYDGTIKGHTVHSVLGMIPEGAKKIAIMPRQNSNVVFTVPGVYGIRCKKHDRHGMISVVVVGGDIHNIEKARLSASKWVNKFVQPKMQDLLDHAQKQWGDNQ